MPSGAGGLCQAELCPYSPEPTVLRKNWKVSAFPRGKAYEGGEQDNKAGESAADVMRVLVHILQNHAEGERLAARCCPTRRRSSKKPMRSRVAEGLSTVHPEPQRRFGKGQRELSDGPGRAERIIYVCSCISCSRKWEGYENNLNHSMSISRILIVHRGWSPPYNRLG